MERLGTQLYELARALGPQLVSLATAFVCIVIALVRRKRHPRASLVTIIALVFLILHTIVFAIAGVVLSDWFILGRGVASSSFYLVFNTTSSLTLAVVFGILLVAIFGQRNTDAQLR